MNPRPPSGSDRPGDDESWRRTGDGGEIQVPHDEVSIKIGDDTGSSLNAEALVASQSRIRLSLVAIEIGLIVAAALVLGILLAAGYGWAGSAIFATTTSTALYSLVSRLRERQN